MLTLWGKGGYGCNPNGEAGKGVSTHPLLSISERRDGRGKVWLSGHMIHSIMTRRREVGWACRGERKGRGIDIDTRKIRGGRSSRVDSGRGLCGRKE